MKQTTKKNAQNKQLSIIGQGYFHSIALFLLNYWFLRYIFYCSYQPAMFSCLYSKKIRIDPSCVLSAHTVMNRKQKYWGWITVFFSMHNYQRYWHNEVQCKISRRYVYAPKLCWCSIHSIHNRMKRDTF